MRKARTGGSIVGPDVTQSRSGNSSASIRQRTLDSPQIVKMFVPRRSTFKRLLSGFFVLSLSIWGKIFRSSRDLSKVPALLRAKE